VSKRSSEEARREIATEAPSPPGDGSLVILGEDSGNPTSPDLRRFSTRRVVHVAILAALYAVLTWGVAPIGYGQVQLRVSEVLKVLVLFDPWLVLGIGIGTFFANLTSPFVGPWELAWMPLTDMVGGLLAWMLYRFVLRGHWPVLPMAIYALTTGLAVGLMLWAFGLGIFWLLAGAVAVSELIILIAGTPLMFWIEQTLEGRGVGLRPPEDEP
jgi:uncharacterized membrane protein